MNKSNDWNHSNYEQKWASPKPDQVDESAPEAQYCFFVQRKIGMFLLEIKVMNNHKERWNTFSTHFELRLPLAWGWDGLTQQFIWFRVPDPASYLAQRKCDDWGLYAATLHLGRSMGGFPLFPLATVSLLHFTKKKKKQNEINRSRGGMKPLKLKEWQHQRVSLHPL